MTHGAAVRAVAMSSVLVPSLSEGLSFPGVPVRTPELICAGRAGQPEFVSSWTAPLPPPRRGGEERGGHHEGIRMFESQQPGLERAAFFCDKGSNTLHCSASATNSLERSLHKTRFSASGVVSFYLLGSTSLPTFQQHLRLTHLNQILPSPRFGCNCQQWDHSHPQDHNPSLSLTPPPLPSPPHRSPRTARFPSALTSIDKRG